MLTWKNLLTLVLLLCAAVLHCTAQENVVPVNHNPFLTGATYGTTTARKGTAATLPFFEDFTGSYVYPDSNKWLDREVYVNNTMAALPISRGVATFDALNALGGPYDSTNPGARYADSLTSVPIDLSLNSPADSVYLSFFYQPAGNGFAPDPGDSLMLYFLTRSGEWRKVWAVDGNNVSQPFQQVMIPLTDTLLFYSGFQFQFVNIASLSLNDDIWNVDYIKMAANRNMYDTAVNDIAFGEEASFMLNDYTYMPYRQFLANINGERATQQQVHVRNNYTGSQSVVFTHTGTELTTGTSLGTAGGNSLTVPARTDQTANVNVFTATIPSPGNYSKVTFENKFYFNGTPAGDYSKGNDTIVQEQIFDNYLAYDDGTAEKSYFLNLFPTLPGTVAIEYHLNQADTLRGMAVYFGRSLPLASSKFFTAQVYSQLAGVSGATTDNLLYHEDFLQPGYADTVNHFWYYRFVQPIALPAGTFYLASQQPALSGSDSLYYGLDLNRVGGNHLYFNVLNVWNSSAVSGALMIRPLLGQTFIGTGVTQVTYTPFAGWNVYPNPATDVLHFNTDGESVKDYVFEIADIRGSVVITGHTTEGADLRNLPPGMYLARIKEKGVYSEPKKIIKL
ncbi:T9SS type A sorting domain-containing protein [Chitinophagaceae bacterium MMS25-I14]